MVLLRAPYTGNYSRPVVGYTTSVDLVLETPVRLRLPDSLDRKKLELVLTFTDSQVKQEIIRLKGRRRWIVASDGEEEYRRQMEELESRKTQRLLFEDERGLWTYSGLRQKVESVCPGLNFRVDFDYPKLDPLPFRSKPQPGRYYQVDAVDRLKRNRHASVELATGLGKTWCIERFVHEVGHESLVVAPTRSIANNIANTLSDHFFPGVVGKFFDGQKDFKRHVVVATPQSLVNVLPGTITWQYLSAPHRKVLVVDESHMCPTNTLSKICLGRFENRRWIPGLAADVPYRTFFSGTQIRNDGKELLLEATIGPVVATKSFREGVDEGFLARPRFYTLNVESAARPESDDPMELTRRHLFRDANVARLVADVANNLLANDFSVLFLLGELSQFPPLLGNLRYPVALAHGGGEGTSSQKAKKKAPSDMIPREYLDMEVETEVARFNARESRCLAGTSCISVGTDIKPRGPTAVFYLMGMTSEIMFRQAVGRGSRREGKEEFLLFDVRVTNVEALRRHADERAKLCEQMYERAQDL